MGGGRGNLLLSYSIATAAVACTVERATISGCVIARESSIVESVIEDAVECEPYVVEGAACGGAKSIIERTARGDIERARAPGGGEFQMGIVRTGVGCTDRARCIDDPPVIDCGSGTDRAFGRQTWFGLHSC